MKTFLTMILLLALSFKGWNWAIDTNNFVVGILCMMFFYFGVPFCMFIKMMEDQK